jgi:hypothetical protein
MTMTIGRTDLRSGDVFWAGTQNTSLLYVNDAGRVVMKGEWRLVWKRWKRCWR